MTLPQTSYGRVAMLLGNSFVLTALRNPRNWKRVIGVVSTIRHAFLGGPLQANVYLAAGALKRASFLVIRTDRPTGKMDKAVRRAIAAVDPDQPVLLSASMQALITDTVAGRRADASASRHDRRTWNDK